MLKLQQRASALVENIANGLASPSGYGGMSAAVYDTAWVSLIEKGDGSAWAFPQCFDYVLSMQGSNGLWPKYHSQVDEILNSLAALYALIVHRERKLSPQDSGANVDQQVELCKEGLAGVLATWRVDECVHVGFEILVPNLLQRLEEYGVTFDFPGRAFLMSLNEKKTRGFTPEALYLSQQTTLLHSLEVFVGKIDFEKVRHHLANGSFLGSPSSTAAYLLSTSHRDEAAEEFIHSALKSQGGGAVPSAFPSSIFETTWALSTLLGVGFAKEDLGEPNLRSIASWLEQQFNQQDGLLGFAPGYLADADDTAKAITTLHRLGVHAECESMITEFSNTTHFRTYRYESNASFSANCNVLMALLSVESPSDFSSEIHVAVDFLCDQWYHGPIRDKWNLSPEYSSMLLAQALTALVRCWSDGQLDSTFSNPISSRISIILLQLLTRALQSQDKDGSWSSSTEVTAYAIIAISKCLTLSWGDEVRVKALEALSKGKLYLEATTDKWKTPNRLWVEKVSYGSPFLAETYCLAAMKCCFDAVSGAFNNGIEIHQFSSDQSKKLCKFFSKIPLLEGLKYEDVANAMAEATIYFKSLQQIQTEIFPPQNKAEDKYLQYVPFTWTACNKLCGNALSNQIVWEMIVFSMWIYQVDEYMEAVVSGLSESNIGLLEDMIRERCQCPVQAATQFTDRHERTTKPPANSSGLPPTPAEQGSPMSHALEEAFNVLGKFIDRVQFHPAMLRSSNSAKQLVGRELATFLLAHIQHNKDNARFMSEQHNISVSETVVSNTLLTYRSPRTSYFQWVRSTSADTTSCPFAFAFFCCLISTEGKAHCLSGPKQQYFGQALCRHLATMCRQYNDYGSLQRDQAELNLNSLNFPEFGESLGGDPANGRPEPENISKTITPPEMVAKSENVSKAKGDLMEIAEYERTIVNSAMSKLKGLTSSKTATALQTFVDVTDLYGQIYVMRDVTNRVK